MKYSTRSIKRIAGCTPRGPDRAPGGSCSGQHASLPTVCKVAPARGVPDRLLLKILVQLRRSGLIHGVQSLRGGYRLARPADRVSQLHAVEAVDGPVRSDVAEIGTDQALNGLLQAVCDRAALAVRRALAAVSMADLVGDRRKTKAGGAL